MDRDNAEQLFEAGEYEIKQGLSRIKRALYLRNNISVNDIEGLIHENKGNGISFMKAATAIHERIYG